MARLVEFMGPPGTGKTATFKAAVLMRPMPNRRLTSDEAIAGRTPLASQNDPLLKLAGRVLASSQSTGDVKHRRFAATQVALGRVQVVAALVNPLVLTDESLLGWGLSFGLCQGVSQELLAEFFWKIPKPFHVIHYHSDEATASRRNAGRVVRGRIDRFPDWRAATATALLAVDIMKQRGVRVTAMNAANELKVNARETTLLMEELSAGRTP